LLFFICSVIVASLVKPSRFVSSSFRRFSSTEALNELLSTSKDLFADAPIPGIAAAFALSSAALSSVLSA
jgi:hypothetical protein